MKITISGKNIDVTEGLKAAVNEKLGKLEKYFTPDTNVIVTLSVEKERQKIEVTIPVKGNIIRSEQVSNDMYVSIDLVEEVIERQLRKYKNKIVDKQQAAANFQKEYIDKDYEVKEIDGYVGSLYGYTNDPILKNSPELFTYYKPKSDYKTYYYAYDTLAPKGEGSLFYDGVGSGYAYGVFLGSDAIHTKIVTELDTGRKACVFKESYGNAFVPYLVDSFDEIYVIDIRYFGMNAVEYMKQQGITDVIFINNAFAANTGSLIEGIENLYNYPYGTLTADEIPAVEAYRSTSVTQAAETEAADDKAED